MQKLAVNVLITSHKIDIKDISYILQLQLRLKDTILSQITCLQSDVSQIQLTTIIWKASTHTLSLQQFWFSNFERERTEQKQQCATQAKRKRNLAIFDNSVEYRICQFNSGAH